MSNIVQIFTGQAGPVNKKLPGPRQYLLVPGQQASAKLYTVTKYKRTESVCFFHWHNVKLDGDLDGNTNTNVKCEQTCSISHDKAVYMPLEFLLNVCNICVL